MQGTLKQRATLFALSLFLLLTHVAQTRAQSNLTFEGGESFNVPFELVDNRIFVGVWLEGKGPFRFILDTGGYGGISLETAKRIGARLGNVGARGPADEAGLKVGDRVVAVEGRSVESLKLISTRESLKDARRKSVRLTVQTGATAPV